MRLSDARLRDRQTECFIPIIDCLLGSTEMILPRSLEPMVRRAFRVRH